MPLLKNITGGSISLHLEKNKTILILPKDKIDISEDDLNFIKKNYPDVLKSFYLSQGQVLPSQSTTKTEASNTTQKKKK